MGSNLHTLNVDVVEELNKNLDVHANFLVIAESNKEAFKFYGGENLGRVNFVTRQNKKK